MPPKRKPGNRGTKVENQFFMNMEEQNNMGGRRDCSECPVCHGKMCGWGMMHHHGCGYHVIRWALGLVILVIVFAFGIMIGELKGTFDASFGYRMMNGYGYGYSRAYPMMEYGYGVPTSQSAAPSAQTAPTAHP